MKKKKLISALMLCFTLILPTKADDISIIGQTINDNIGAANGAGVAVNAAGDTLTITNSTFTNNSGGYSGGIYNSGNLVISDGTEDSHTTFEGNYNSQTWAGGGAIYSYASGTNIQIGDYTSFIDNHSDMSGVNGGQAGGALYIGNATHLTIGDYVNFSDNSANNGNLSFGGAMYIENSQTQIGNNLNVESNSSNSSGGGISICNIGGATASIGDNANFKDNTSLSGSGGAISSDSTNMQIGNNAVFEENKAANNGGAIAVSSNNNESFTIGNNAQFINNTAGNNGGAIYNDGSITINGATFTGNSALKGGALYNTENGTSNLTNVIFNAGNGSVKNDIFNAGSIITSGNNTFASDITNTGTINFGGTNTISSSISGNGSIINNGEIVNNSSISTKILNNNSQVTGFGNLIIQEGGTNSGSIEQAIINITANQYTNDETITATDTFTNSGNISGNGTINITDLNGNSNNSGQIEQNTINISGNKFTNTGSIATTGSFSNNAINLENNSTISSEGNFSNSEKISGSGTINISDIGGNSNNTGLIEQAIVNISGNKFSNNGTITTTNTFTNTATITGNGNLNITDNSGNSNNNGIIEQAIVNISGDKFSNNGTITATDSFVNSATNLENNSIITSEETFSNIGGITGSGSLNISDGSNTGTISGQEINVNENFTNNGKLGTETNSVVINNNGTITNNNSIIASAIDNATGKSIINSNTITVDSINNLGAISGENGVINIGGGTNSGNIEQADVNIIGDLTNSGNIKANNFSNNANITGSGNLVLQKGINNGIITQESLELNGSLENNNEITVSEFTNNKSAILTNNGTFTVNTNMTNIGTIINKGNFDSGSGSIMENIGTFINSGEDAKMNATEIVNNNIFGAIDGASLNLTNIDNDNGTLLISNNSSISISNQKEALGGILNVEKGTNYLDINGNSSDFAGTLNIGNSNNDISSLYFQNSNITENATLNIEKGGELYAFDSANINLNQGDNIKGDIFISDTAGDITLNNYSLSTGEISTKEGGEEAFYTQLGGRLNLTNNSSLAMKNLSGIQGGDINIDSTSKFIALTEDYGGIYSLNNLNTSGLFSAINNDIDEYNIKNLNIGTNILGSQDNQADFTIDVYGRSNAEDEHATDQFIGENLTGSGTVNISDWNLGGDIFGWDAPIDRDINLDNIFKYDSIAPTISLTATKKEVFTPIGWYQLNNHSGITGNYTLNLTRFNPQVYRGQVTTLAQYMNQLAVNDMLFNHSMLLPSFKDEDIGYTGTMANRYAATNPVFAPYQYSRKDGGLWYRMYGTFETLQMSQGLSNVGNNAYGTIIGADFGLKELKNGWKFMPTAYIGYNGAHQYFAGMGAYQNGGQAGFLGTWYKDNFIIGGLIYGGVYQNSMDIAGHTDNTFNYFAGAATKAAYNWRFHRDWVLQPNLLLSYNFFGQQNWHSDFGQMGMMSGTLNGINLAPGLNLIWEKETFSIYATLQYMYNLNGAVDGRAGNVSLPHLYMDRGYIQYGFGVTKRFTDRCAGYFQTVFRNVGRTGVGFQLGFNILLGK